jgi:UDP-N-acetylglucosamine 1-carboxyvinyltransferase
MHVSELKRMGADIQLETTPPSSTASSPQRRARHGQRSARLRGPGPRGLQADGVTEVNRVYHIDRGYE